MADSRPIVVEQPTERARAFLRLADDHLDAAYRLARAILHDSIDAQDATHDAFEQACIQGCRALDAPPEPG